MKKHHYRSDFLFAGPSFLYGLARALDMGGTFARYNECETGPEADFLARLCDWMVVQQDLDDSWARVVDANPEFVRAWLDAVRKDPSLLKRQHSPVCQEKVNELALEMETRT